MKTGSRDATSAPNAASMANIAALPFVNSTRLVMPPGPPLKEKTSAASPFGVFISVVAYVGEESFPGWFPRTRSSSPLFFFVSSTKS